MMKGVDSMNINIHYSDKVIKFCSKYNIEKNLSSFVFLDHVKVMIEKYEEEKRKGVPTNQICFYSFDDKISSVEIDIKDDNNQNYYISFDNIELLK